ncbi:hypothetical protein QBC47DRAFT_365410 [Echria macrotheca]|uniref:Uncharacterized protein n=1 Tax=Echria macrotheca TaxID=438768 RepID=A0AAJ0B6H0_9PEZI|nr:hypothetical protein QBC47DRAFT_365410 [Echria macrotheca]
MNGCYCANYYGSIACPNRVSKFGDRCKLCLALKSGSSLSHGLLDDNDLDLWMSPSSTTTDNNPSDNRTSTTNLRPFTSQRSDSWTSTGSSNSANRGSWYHLGSRRFGGPK